MNFRKKVKLFGYLILTLLYCSTFSSAETFSPKYPDKKDKCPVCGMFVAKYPVWTAEIIFQDGSTYFFDGPKDLFRFYFNITSYSPKQKIDFISNIYVTEYYDTRFIKAQTGWYVVGSDVYGPMGKELIPFKSEDDAKQFFSDHKGEEILQFNAITAEMIKGM